MALRARVALTLVLALLAAACSGGGGAGDDPKDQLVAALRAMSDDEGARLTLSLDTDEASLRALSSSGDPLPPEVAEAISKVKVRFSGSFSDDPGAPVEFALLVSGDAVAELRFVEEVLYVRADVPALLEAFGQDPAMADGLRQMLGQTGMVPPEAIDGAWVGIGGMGEAMRQMTGQDPSSEESAAQAQRMRDALAGVLRDVTDVERVGADDAGDQLRLHVPLRDLYDAVLAEAPKLGLPAELPPRDEVPDETVTVDVWVRDDRITQASLDLLQIVALDPDAGVPEGAEGLDLLLELAPFDGVVEPPADAAMLDGEQLMGMLFMGLGGMMSGMDPSTGMPGMSGMPGASGVETEPASFEGGGPNPVLMAFWSRAGYAEARALYCEQVADMPESVRRKHYADICPALV